MTVIESIKILLEEQVVKEQQLKERIGLLNSLDDTISKLMHENPDFSFRGALVFGSILNRRFTEESDIDVYTCWEGYRTHIYPIWMYLGDFEARISRQLHEGPIIIDDNFPLILTRANGRKEFAGIPFGVFLGDESYIHKHRIKTLGTLDSLGDGINWDSAQRYFKHWANKDLTNSEENYGLSSIQRLKRVYLN
ncbi:MAG: hypothetical protein AABX33_00980 [Nanoarchaeota archaeon]